MLPPVDEEEQDANEHTALLKNSKKSSMRAHGSSASLELAQDENRPEFSTNHPSSLQHPNGSYWKTHHPMRMVGGVILVCLVAAELDWLFFRYDTTSHPDNALPQQDSTKLRHHSSHDAPSDHHASIKRLFDDKDEKDTVFPKLDTLHAPFSTKHPVDDLELPQFWRPLDSQPHPNIQRQKGLESTASYPTNSWYLNMLQAGDHPGRNHRAYTIPYVVDVVGPVPGLQIHPNHIDASVTEVHVNHMEQYGMTLGAESKEGASSETMDLSYRVAEMTPLGLTLEWNAFSMHSSIVRGMPYSTMVYEHPQDYFPTIASQLKITTNPLVDGGPAVLNCTSGKLVWVQHEVELFFQQSDFTWLIFVSRPVQMQCLPPDDRGTRLRVLSPDDDALTIRTAIYKVCSTNSNPVYCHAEEIAGALQIGQGRYKELLRQGADVYPGRDTSITHHPIPHGSDDEKELELAFHWDPILMRSDGNTTTNDLLSFALPHHVDQIPTDHLNGMTFPETYCAHSILGPACLLRGASWTLRDKIPALSFRAPRPPARHFWPTLIQTLQEDLNYRLPEFYQHGAGDTYFSGKMLAKLGRICLIAEEMLELCIADPGVDGSNACASFETLAALLPQAIAALRQSVEVWINGKAETPFVYDPAWGGVVSCGCDFDGATGTCRNAFPSCPAFYDPGLNFGNAYYNDQHFHYGYHIYGAAVVAHFDPEWGRQHFEEVMLLVRNIANPSKEDAFFTEWRHKDWYQGHSWASGFATAYLNGRNQESSSEAIAAYEAVALYGRSMKHAWKKAEQTDQAQVAQAIEETGLYLTASELRSAHTYYHANNPSIPTRIFPKTYQPLVVGILWQTMAQFQTWFGSAPYLAYGIQLLPLTPVSELRDGLMWMEALYLDLAQSCESQSGCQESGWKILQLAALATVGYQQLAADQTMALASGVFEDAGGNGHSLSNTIWYIASRPSVAKPISINKPSKTDKDDNKDAAHDSVPAKKPQEVDLKYCGLPDTCTDYVLDTIADEYSCRQRMTWLVRTYGLEVFDACIKVASKEFNKQCGKCNPSDEANRHPAPRPSAKVCPPCSTDVCQSPLNRCPRYEQTYLCTEGPSYGGCAAFVWQTDHPEICTECCELTECPEFSPMEEVSWTKEQDDLDRVDNCPPCTKEDCESVHYKCSTNPAAPFVCLEGRNQRGCSPRPWLLKPVECDRCCEISNDCHREEVL